MLRACIRTTVFFNFPYSFLHGTLRTVVPDIFLKVKFKNVAFEMFQQMWTVGELKVTIWIPIASWLFLSFKIANVIQQICKEQLYYSEPLKIRRLVYKGSLSQLVIFRNGHFRTNIWQRCYKRICEVCMLRDTAIINLQIQMEPLSCFVCNQWKCNMQRKAALYFTPPRLTITLTGREPFWKSSINLRFFILSSQ